MLSISQLKALLRSGKYPTLISLKKQLGTKSQCNKHSNTEGINISLAYQIDTHAIFEDPSRSDFLTAYRILLHATA